MVEPQRQMARRPNAKRQNAGRQNTHIGNYDEMHAGHNNTFGIASPQMAIQRLAT